MTEYTHAFFFDDSGLGVQKANVPEIQQLWTTAAVCLPFSKREMLIESFKDLNKKYGRKSFMSMATEFSP